MRKGQSIGEYAFVVAVVIAAVMALQPFMAKMVMGKTYSKLIDFAGEDKLQTGALQDDDVKPSVSFTNGFERINLANGVVSRNWNETTTTKVAPDN